VPFFLGLLLIIIHSVIPGVIPDGLDLVIGLILTVGAGAAIAYWTITFNRATPPVEYFRPDQAELGEATPEILYLLEDGWGVKKIVDMIASNYQLPPKLVYDHVMDLMASRRETLDAGVSPLHMGGGIKSDSTPMEVYHSTKDED
jgi:hypothetical protein